MSEPPAAKRRREKYSKLICLGCRARRIRCILPDITILPSPEPQSADKACQRCQQNGLDCIVDYTTLGRPAQKRSHIELASNQQPEYEQPQFEASNHEEVDNTTSHDVGNFLLSQPEAGEDGGPIVKTNQKPTREEICDAMISPFHLLSALLARDKTFASAIGSQPLVGATVLEIVDDQLIAVLDHHLVWHKLYYPDVPSLPTLCREIKAIDVGRPERTAGIYLLTLLCDLALDVPAVALDGYRHLQPAIRALTYHCGQQVMFTLARSRYTVTALILTAQYRPLALTSSQMAGSHALKALPHIVIARHVATQLGYQTAGSRLTQALTDVNSMPQDLASLLQQCFCWVRLNIAEDSLPGKVSDWVRDMDPTAYECLEGLHSAARVDRIPREMLLAYSSLSYGTQALARLKEISDNWRTIDRLGEVILEHRGFCEREKVWLEGSLGDDSTSWAVSHIADMERHLTHTTITGAALFFSVMSGVYASSVKKHIEADQAVQISDNIIESLLAHGPDDPDRPPHRRFMETFGETRMGELERILTNFITATDNFTLNGVPFVARTRDQVSFILFVCKDVVENNAAMMKGWGALHDRVDVQMILFHECARRLEGMSATAGTDDALAKGCILTATAKLIRNLHRILHGFKRYLTSSQHRNTSAPKSDTDPTPESTGEPGPVWSENPLFDTTGEALPGADDPWPDDMFAEWDNWPTFDAFDFSDLFGNAVNFDPNVSF